MKENDLPAGVSCEIKEEGMNNNSSRVIKLEYLQEHWKTVAKINGINEYEIVPSKYCKKDEIVWVLEENLAGDTTRSDKCRIQCVNLVGGHDDLDISSVVETVELSQKLEHRPLDLSRARGVGIVAQKLYNQVG